MITAVDSGPGLVCRSPGCRWARKRMICAQPYASTRLASGDP